MLYDLLGEREEAVNISHRGMPSFVEHICFVASCPYQAWYFICDPDPVGACYLSKDDEIGVFVFKAHQGQGYGRKAIELLIEQHGPRRYLANVNPENTPSRALFERMDFKLLQCTFERRA